MWLDEDEPEVAEVAPLPDWPAPSSAELVALRAALKESVARIAAAEEAFYARERLWLDCGSEAEARARMVRPPEAWVGDGCWTTLGVELGTVAGGFFVTVDAKGYRVQGWLDRDRDGAPMKVVATHSLPASFSTPSTVR